MAELWAATSPTWLRRHKFLSFAVVFALWLMPFVAFQKRMLPWELSRIIARLYFWPTLPLTILRSQWASGGPWTVIDDGVLLLGVAPVALLGHPRALRRLGVTGVVNMAAEYSGPVGEYERLGIQQLRLPTVDHFEPSIADLVRAVKFIEERRIRKELVYVHCKAGHGRAAAVALAWMLHSRSAMGDDSGDDGDHGDGAVSGDETLQALNEELLTKRAVRRTLHQQPHLREFATWVRSGRHLQPLCPASTPAALQDGAAGPTAVEVELGCV